MATISIQIAVDAASLASQVASGSIKAGTQSSPTSLGAWSDSNVFITMTSQNSNVTNNSQGQSELNVKANSGDQVQWFMTTFDNNVDYTAFLYNGTFNPNTAFSGLTYITPQVNNYLPPTNNPTGSLTKFTNNENYAIGTVLQVGTSIQYTLSFTLVNNSNGSIIGYFTWDPFITVN
ncbi:Inclusion body protein [Flavobacterium columnare]|uniref:AidA/PixA family protein n=2 Tax=Flavobacterium TaxID=237 RepID=A0ABW8PPU3_9FLAO|nr:AidA/PixA family protein [Flavobacterium columnare]SPE77783.1 Inclusion body protein [Flavobacterium columnare]